jgi:cytochrome P450 family 3 subfamily A
MILLTFTLILGAAVWYIYHKLTYWQRRGVPTPGLFYQWHYYRRELGPYDQYLHKKLGPIYGTYEGLTPILIVGEPDAIREILVKDFQSFPNHKPFRFGIPLVDLNLFSLDGGEDWKRIRSIVSPTFTSGKLRGMDPIVHEAIDLLKEHLSKAAKDGKPVNARTLYNSLSFDVIVRCAYGAKVDVITDPNNPIMKNMENLFSGRWDTFAVLFMPKIARFLNLHHRAMKPFQFFEDMSKKLLDDRKIAGTSGQKNDFLQLMVDASRSETGNKSISDVEMMAQALIFLLAGFDTTATILACSVYHLAKNPDVQEKLTAEVASISNINHDTVMELRYLEAVLKECFRLSPPAIRVERQCVAKTQVGKVTVEPGTIVSIPVFAVHRDPQQFKDPETFNPDRFLDGGEDVDHHPYAFLPFGGGPRMCIAQRFALMEAKMALALVLKKFHFEATPDTKLAYAPASFDVLAPKEILVRVKEIQVNEE